MVQQVLKGRAHVLSSWTVKCLVESQPGHAQYSVKICWINDMLNEAELQTQTPAKQRAEPPESRRMLGACWPRGSCPGSSSVSSGLTCRHLTVIDKMTSWIFSNSWTHQKANLVTGLLCATPFKSLGTTRQRPVHGPGPTYIPASPRSTPGFTFWGPATLNLEGSVYAVLLSLLWAFDCAVLSAENACTPHSTCSPFLAWLNHPTQLQRLR